MGRHWEREAEMERLTEQGVSQPLRQLADGEVLLKIRLISLDAANRAWMQGATYRAALAAGQVMAGGSISEVVESKSPGFAPGDLVFADTGWQEYAALPAKALTKQTPRGPLSLFTQDRPGAGVH
mgnify:CR=1 FL=1